MNGSALLKTKGVILAGTYRWTNSMFDRLAPRPLLPVANRPLISYALSWLGQGGVCDVVLCTNRETGALQTRLAQYVPEEMRPQYHEDRVPQGSAGCLREAACGSDAETFVVVDGTTIPSVELGELLRSHHASGAAVTVVVHNETPRNEKPGRWVPNGIYIFERRTLTRIQPRVFFDIKEHLIPLLYNSGERVIAYSAQGASPRVVNAATYLAVNEWMVQRIAEGRARSNGHTADDVVDSGALIAKDAVLVGSVMIGPGARVRSGATIVGPTSIGAGSTVECGGFVGRSAGWNRCVIGQEAVADRCILGDDVVVDPLARVFGTVKVVNGRSAVRGDQGWPRLLGTRGTVAAHA